MEHWFGIVLATILGMAWGSFATMAVYRIPHGEPWIGRKPFCPKCSHELNFLDYISLLSYVLWRGKCRYCNAKYDLRGVYFLTELSVTTIHVLAYLVFGFTEMFLITTLLGTAMIVNAMIELHHKSYHTKPIVTASILAIIFHLRQEGHDSYTLMFAGGVALGVGLLCRHVYFLYKGTPKEGSDYLEFKPEDRFKGKGFVYVKWLGVMGITLLPNVMAFVDVLVFSLFLFGIFYLCKLQHHLLTILSLVTLMHLYLL